jgi:hypothetical protein
VHKNRPIKQNRELINSYTYSQLIVDEPRVHTVGCGEGKDIADSSVNGLGRTMYLHVKKKKKRKWDLSLTHTQN